jgi:hypothetical protein
MRITFQSVVTSRRKAGPCPVCGKRSVRTRRFEHTVNPFNKNRDGSVKTADEVRADVHAEADKWKPDFTHQKCHG